ncbi:MAG: hypothetical protein DRN12_07095 [Thermoplasmata archaeon]|nr:MAG: hypothetical protein DRN12_07095 [Thermoplasmata archaeon]
MNIETIEVSSGNKIFNVKAPAYLQIGDILFCDVNSDILNKFIEIEKRLGIHLPVFTSIGFSNDHCALYIGNNLFIEAFPYRPRPLRLNWCGVVISPLWKIKLWATNITYGHVETASKEQRIKAVEWALARLGRPYQFYTFLSNYNPHDPNDIFSNRWYCSELVWAAYYNQGINISYSFNPSEKENYISPLDIKIDDDIKMYQNIPPISHINPLFSKVEVNRFVPFNATGSYDIDGVITRYYIDFGDGTNETQDDEHYYPSSRLYLIEAHAYKKPGRYKITLTVIDNEGASNTSETFIEVYQPNRPPDKPIIKGPTLATINEKCKFTIISHDPDNDSLNFIVDWDDGTENSTGFTQNSIVNLTHSWSFAGYYEIRVEATDGNKTSFSTFAITICRDIKTDDSSIDNSNSLCVSILVILVPIIILAIFLYTKRKNL